MRQYSLLLKDPQQNYQQQNNQDGNITTIPLIHHHFKVSNGKLVLPLFWKFGWIVPGESLQYILKKIKQNSFLIWNIENNFICNNAINIRVFTIYCNLKFSIKNFLFHFFTICANRPWWIVPVKKSRLCESSQEELVFVRTVP